MSKKVSSKEPAVTRLEATFLVSAPDLKRCPAGHGPEVAFAGRSNAGKSSVLNQVTGNKRTAKVSKTPGRTQLLNFFELKSGGRLVDLPGYGYAKAGKAQQGAWQQAVNEYLSFREELAGMVLVMDIRHPDQPFDQELLAWANESELPVHVLLNKADKLGYGAQQKALQQFRARYKGHANLTVQTFSALKGTGTETLIECLIAWTADEPSSEQST
jgi:GTP-binding protein